MPPTVIQYTFLLLKGPPSGSLYKLQDPIKHPFQIPARTQVRLTQRDKKEAG